MDSLGACLVPFVVEAALRRQMVRQAPQDKVSRGPPPSQIAPKAVPGRVLMAGKAQSNTLGTARAPVAGLKSSVCASTSADQSPILPRSTMMDAFGSW